MSESNKISVVIPAYNAAEFILESINSVLLQSVPVHEIIVVDDGSTDNTFALCNKLAKNEPTLKLISQQNQGVSSARNKGINCAEGNWVAFLDSDDIWLPKKIELQLNLLKYYPEIKMILTDELLFADDQIISQSVYLNTSFASQLPTQPGPIDKIMTFLLTESFVSTSSVLVNKKLLVKSGLFNTNISICEDRELWIKLANNAKVGLVPEVLVRKRQFHGNNLSSLPQIKWAKTLFKLLSELEADVNQKLISENSKPKKIFANNYFILANIFWYNDDLKMAEKAFKKSFTRGKITSIYKLILCLLGANFITLLRRLKT